MIEFICNSHNIKPRHKTCVATIGNFDGLHQGHQKVIQALIKLGKQLDLPICVILFEPHPQEFFYRDQAPARLMRLREKIKFLQFLTIDRVLCLRFNKRLAECSAEEFVKKILIDKLGVKGLIIGDDFRFGRGRQGDFSFLQKLGQEYGFKVFSTPTVLFENERIGSSRVRRAVKQADFKLASLLLGRSFKLSGRVIYGDQRGRLIGFPTANIGLHRQILPLQGVFIVNVYGLASTPLAGVANIGKRPTVNGLRNLLEVYLFDFDQNIYGRFIEVEFLKKIRDEKKFDNLTALKHQITKDVTHAKNYFMNN
ncbi:bifunctional riboflavin kinase/FAD synthetase [Candidatus Rickettsiella isopodorum]|jgi:riboflavin kinase/FMN adenylyltransferase|uniref:bifunctional riboflavin kinase/FAD synthetase n=1 Tax=Candidatus Rickettsiella isopodorum TaxID=1225476 RepID=UPI000B002ABD|nr:bifunctional riboflavin kinase/FAD synthetase [Candidatus Rickettsiella isopodorum]